MNLEVNSNDIDVLNVNTTDDDKFCDSVVSKIKKGSLIDNESKNKIFITQIYFNNLSFVVFPSPYLYSERDASYQNNAFHLFQQENVLTFSYKFRVQF